MYVGFQVLAVLIVFIIFWYGVSIFYRGIKTKQLRLLCEQQKAIVLTYDDGPSAKLSGELVMLLKERQKLSTFFFLGNAAQEHEQTAAMIAEQGNDIGSHTYSHSNAWKTNPWHHFLDIKSGRSSLTAIGMGTSLFRPPYGKVTLGVLIQAFFAKTELVFWTIDSQDSWDRRSIPDILEDIRKNNGGVILMHDRERPLRGPSPEKHPEYLIALTTAILDMADEEEYNVIRFTDLHAKSKVNLS